MEVLRSHRETVSRGIAIVVDAAYARRLTVMVDRVKFDLSNVIATRRCGTSFVPGDR